MALVSALSAIWRSERSWRQVALLRGWGGALCTLVGAQQAQQDQQALPVIALLWAVRRQASSATPRNGRPELQALRRPHAAVLPAQLASPPELQRPPSLTFN